MSAPVDVLAVMDDAAHALNHTRTTPERIALLEARAAVAELIEAGADVADFTPEERRRDWSCHMGITTAADCCRCGPALRFAAALASVGGAE